MTEKRTTIHKKTVSTGFENTVTDVSGQIPPDHEDYDFPHGSAELSNDASEIKNEGIYEMDAQMNFESVDEAFCQILGHTKKEIEGKNFTEFMDQKHARMAYHALTKVWVTHKGLTEIIWQVNDKNGEARVVELSAYLIRNKEGQKLGFRGMAHEITEEYRAREALKASEQLYQCEYDAARRAEKRARNLLNFIPYPMVVFNLDGKVTYLNPAFTETFGWTLDELIGRRIPYVPEELKEETKEGIKRLLEEKIINRIETKRLTTDGRVLDIIMRGAVFAGDQDSQGGELVILRDVTQEKKMARNNETLQRISNSLPIYPDLEELLDYISNEVKGLMNTDGVLVILLDEERQEFYFKSAAYSNKSTQKMVKEFRFPADKGLAGKVVRTGEPVIVQDTSNDPDFYPFMDQQLGYTTKNIVEVPLRTSDRVIGVLCALNKKGGAFDQSDLELLGTISATVALSIENARFSEEIKSAYREVSSLNRAKDKVINHLSHELKTPLTVLSASLNILKRKLVDFPDHAWKPTIDRAERNLERILEMQYQIQDIMQDRQFKTHDMLSVLLEVCADELEALVADEVGEGPLVEAVRRRIHDLFGPVSSEASKIRLDTLVKERLRVLKTRFSHRHVQIIPHFEKVKTICLPEDVIQKVVDGLIKNAIENTPDEGKIEISVLKKGEGIEFVVHDYGIGISEDDQRRIFEGFFSTQDTINYSTKKPFDFNAGGKGADLLRMKIFAERYNFRIDLESTLCPYLENEPCPGKISECPRCKDQNGCHQSGGTTFRVYFPEEKGQGG